VRSRAWPSTPTKGNFDLRPKDLIYWHRIVKLTFFDCKIFRKYHFNNLLYFPISVSFLLT
jgi:hypothetical protein